MTNYEENRRDGGTAFSCAGHSPECWPMFQSGMSLRDWFAGMAMHEQFSRTSEWDNGWIEIAAKKAYKMADAMIAERMRK